MDAEFLRNLAKTLAALVERNRPRPRPLRSRSYAHRPRISQIASSPLFSSRKLGLKTEKQVSPPASFPVRCRPSRDVAAQRSTTPQLAQPFGHFPKGRPTDERGAWVATDIGSLRDGAHRSPPEPGSDLARFAWLRASLGVSVSFWHVDDQFDAGGQKGLSESTTGIITRQVKKIQLIQIASEVLPDPNSSRRKYETCSLFSSLRCMRSFNASTAPNIAPTTAEGAKIAVAMAGSILASSPCVWNMTFIAAIATIAVKLTAPTLILVKIEPSIRFTGGEVCKYRIASNLRKSLLESGLKSPSSSGFIISSFQ